MDDAHDSLSFVGHATAIFAIAVPRATRRDLAAFGRGAPTLLDDRAGGRAEPARLAAPAGTCYRRGTVSRPLLAVDGDSFAHRAYHALPRSIHLNAVVGFTNMIVRLWEQEQPRAVFVGWDTLDAPTYRSQAFPAYQSGREFDASVVEQLAMLPRLCEALGFATAKAAGFEADDLLAAAVAAEEARGASSLVASGDRDAWQLASERTTILFPTRGVSELARLGPAEVRERYGVEPRQVPDFIALRGDPSDKLPGARGVGPKTAADILRRYGTLEAALVDGKFAGQADDLRLYRRIATMDPAAPVPAIPDRQPDWAAAARLLREWGIVQLADRLAAR
jgi:DNA polymerase-1